MTPLLWFAAGAACVLALMVLVLVAGLVIGDLMDGPI